MARRVQVNLEDDIDGGPAVGTMMFMLDGVNYEIDLNADNNAALRAALAAYISRARRAGRGRIRRVASRANARPATTALDRARNDAVRTWAKENGISVAERGRIPAHVLAQYNQRSSTGRRSRKSS